jgi:hypothetical protein
MCCTRSAMMSYVCVLSSRAYSFSVDWLLIAGKVVMCDGWYTSNNNGFDRAPNNGSRYYCPTYLQILQLVDSSYANSCTTSILLIPFELSCVHDARFMNLYWSSILYESCFPIICYAMFTTIYARNLVSVGNSGCLRCLKYMYFCFYGV